MACTSPPELDDRTLLTYVDGEADHKVIMHLEKCLYCREKAQRLGHLQKHLAARLYRVACPPPVELGEYHLGVLSDDRMAAVAQHLAECPHCAQEVAQLESYLGELAPTVELGRTEQVRERIRARAKVLVAHLVGGGQTGRVSQPALVPAYVALRGGEEARIYQADDIQVVVEVQDDAGRPGRKVVLGLVTGPFPAGLQVYVWQDERTIVVVPLDELGNFVIPDLAPGDYELILSVPEMEIHIQTLHIGK